MDDDKYGDSWATGVLANLRECPLCGGSVLFEVSDTKEDSSSENWGVPFNEDQYKTKGLLWRVSCDCGCRMYEHNWHRLVRKWNRRYSEEKANKAVEKVIGQMEHYLPQIRKMQVRIETLEEIVGTRAKFTQRSN